jgi:hypothetical protein
MWSESSRVKMKRRFVIDHANGQKLFQIIPDGRGKHHLAFLVAFAEGAKDPRSASLPLLDGENVYR